MCICVCVCMRSRVFAFCVCVHLRLLASPKGQWGKPCLPRARAQVRGGNAAAVAALAARVHSGATPPSIALAADGSAVAGADADGCGGGGGGAAAAPVILYVGDNLHSDVLASARAGWLTIGVVEELEEYDAPGATVTTRIPAAGGGAAATCRFGGIWGNPLACEDGSPSYLAWTLSMHCCAAVSDVTLLHTHGDVLGPPSPPPAA